MMVSGDRRDPERLAPLDDAVSEPPVGAATAPAFAADPGTESEREDEIRAPRDGEAILRFSDQREADGLCYHVAGQAVWSDMPLPQLGRPDAHGPLPRRRPSNSWRRHPPVYSGPTWLAGAVRHLDARWEGSRAWLEIEGGITWTVDREAARAELTAAGAPPAPAERLEELAFGPPLLLLLAAHGVWALHASAAWIDGRLVAFVGESGAGKSTFASASEPGFERAADDLLPVELIGDRLRAHLDYPQLKLDPVRRDSAPAPLAAVIGLAGPGSAPEPHLDRLTPGEVARLLLGQTMSSRLFCAELLSAHLFDCIASASRLPGFRLSLPRDLERLPAARTLVGDAVRGLDR